ncbi:DNA polymerase/3'-5' exonuclease PolX [Phycisphaerales bacterium AB-hyl4]|uniref:DNA polymerase beta n=1 Tax=Natronomicrosphaera hydrolytica TaxID=3242702 RepID=A0ABV4U3W0_9BACT
MPGNNTTLAAIFQQMADVTELLGGNRFRVNAFQRAARSLQELGEDVAGIDPGRLSKLDGIGSGTADRIREYLDHGRIDEHEKLIKEVPAGVIKLLDIPGLGPKSVATLWQQGGVTDTATLKKKLDTGELEKLPRMGKKTLENIKKNLAFAETAHQRIRIGEAMPLANWFVHQLRGLEPVEAVHYAGSLRRGRETVGDLDLLAIADPKQGETISNAFVKLEVVEEVILKGATKTSVRARTGAGRHIQVDLRVIEPEAAGAALLYFTGSKDHNVRLRERAIARKLKLSEYGLYKEDSETRVAGKTEEAVYKALDLAYIPPELREARDEIARAEKDTLPELVELQEIQAELHAHTTASDGHWSIRELAAAAADRGFHTVAITDHSKGQVQANGLNAERLEKHIEDVRAVAKEMKGKINVLAGSEVDILIDGKLDYPDSLLRELDIVVASPHASLAQEPAKATKRLLKAIENRYVTILGHATGRIVNRRAGLHPDMKKLVEAAAQRGIAMEINANHYRLDLRDTHARLALEHGVKLSINTDAHGPADLDQLIYGVLTARRAGAKREDVINTFAKPQLMKWINATRP